MDSKRLPDTPWHLGYAKKKENDPRRHKSRCIHLKNSICHCGSSGAYKLNCPGSSHCKFYAESEKMAHLVYMRTRTIEEEISDREHDVFIAGKVISSKNCKIESLGKNADDVVYAFSGVRSIKIKNINCPNEYNIWEPNKKDVSELLTYYKEHLKLDKPIVVEIKDNEYYLKDNYLQYYVSKQLNKKWIRATLEGK